MAELEKKKASGKVYTLSEAFIYTIFHVLCGSELYQNTVLHIGEVAQIGEARFPGVVLKIRFWFSIDTLSSVLPSSWERRSYRAVIFSLSGCFFMVCNLLSLRVRAPFVLIVNCGFCRFYCLQTESADRHGVIDGDKQFRRDQIPVS